MRRLSYKVLLTASFALGLHSPSLAVPPPPPSQADTAKLQEFIGGLVNADDARYIDSLADDVMVTQDGALAARSKVEWRKSAWSHLTGGPDHTVKVERVFYGTNSTANGPLIFKAILVERVDRIFGDCCVSHRTDTLTFRGGQIVRLDRSAELQQELTVGGRPQGTP